MTEEQAKTNRRLARKRPDVRDAGSGIYSKTHGMRGTPEYQAWGSIITRCENKNRPSWKNYGGRGIIMCKEWRDSFEIFFADMGKRPTPEHTIERINNNGNYEPGNCRWAHRSEQSSNRRFCKIVQIGGKKVTLAEASRVTGIPYSTLDRRYKSGRPLIEDKKHD